MEVKNILFKLYSDLSPATLPSWLEPEISDDQSCIKSYVWTTNELRRIRLCELNIKGKFIAESLVIYPNLECSNPIFGTEYVNCGGKKYFGTVDFHPLKSDDEYQEKFILKYLGDQPDRIKNQSKIYDLDKYFSKKLWLKTDSEDFYQEYLNKIELYLSRYQECIKKCEQEPAHIYQKAYDYHLSYTDPAYGIIKSHYTKEFAHKYINDFLFDLA